MLLNRARQQQQQKQQEKDFKKVSMRTLILLKGIQHTQFVYNLNLEYIKSLELLARGCSFPSLVDLNFPMLLLPLMLQTLLENTNAS